MTTLLSAAEGDAAGAPGEELNLEAAVALQGAAVKAAKSKAKVSGEEADQQASKVAIEKLLQLKRQLADAQEAAPPSLAPGEVEYSKDFFGKPAYLAVSGQLNGMVLRFLLDRCCAQRLLCLCIRTSCARYTWNSKCI